ncbi:hypothetical protein Misp01_49860 [Microtetraspora sp. NBRC 13810]|nr:hypothetical protein Misp01_49860 [Microtetraspora sp. NBRC 13810]
MLRSKPVKAMLAEQRDDPMAVLGLVVLQRARRHLSRCDEPGTDDIEVLGHPHGDCGNTARLVDDSGVPLILQLVDFTRDLGLSPAGGGTSGRPPYAAPTALT